MPEVRDRISTEEDLATVYTRRRRSIISGGKRNVNLSDERICLLADEAMDGGPSYEFKKEKKMDGGPTTPFRWRTMPMTESRGGGMGVADASVGGVIERGSL